MARRRNAQTTRCVAVKIVSQHGTYAFRVHLVASKRLYNSLQQHRNLSSSRFALIQTLNQNIAVFCQIFAQTASESEINYINSKRAENWKWIFVFVLFKRKPRNENVSSCMNWISSDFILTENIDIGNVAKVSVFFFDFMFLLWVSLYIEHMYSNVEVKLPFRDVSRIYRFNSICLFRLFCWHFCASLYTREAKARV